MASIRNIANGGTSWWNKIYAPVVEYGGKGFEFVKMVCIYNNNRVIIIYIYMYYLLT